MQKHGVNEEYIDKDQFYYISMLTYKAKGRKKKLMYIYIYIVIERERERENINKKTKICLQMKRSINI
jgi:hypothetical protein